MRTGVHRALAGYERRRLMQWRGEQDISLEELSRRMNRPLPFLRRRLQDLDNEIRLKLSRLKD